VPGCSPRRSRKLRRLPGIKSPEQPSLSGRSSAGLCGRRSAFVREESAEYSRHFIRDRRTEPDDVPAEVFEPEGFIALLLPAVAAPNAEAVVCQGLGLITAIAGKWRMPDVADLLSGGRLPMARPRALVGTGIAAVIKRVVKLTLVVRGEDARALVRTVLPADVIRRHVGDPRFGCLYWHYAVFLCEASRYRIADGDAVDFAALCARTERQINATERFELSAYVTVSTVTVLAMRVLDAIDGVVGVLWMASYGFIVRLSVENYFVAVMAMYHWPYELISDQYLEPDDINRGPGALCCSE